MAAIRLAISALIFIPWLLRVGIDGVHRCRAVGLGALQFGLMYCLYIASFAYLPAYGVALLTIFTPLYVAGLAAAANRRWRARHLMAALLAVAGAAVILARGFDTARAWPGILLLQGANLCFAAGQLLYRRLQASVVVAGDARPAEAALLGWMYIGAMLLAGLAALFGGDRGRLGFSGGAIWALLYLGILPTGVGFYLWSKGAARARTGVLAVCNNLKIPLAVLCAWLFFGESADYLRVSGGLAVIVAALFLTGRSRVDAQAERA